ncbi:AFH_G0023420.mRNA.1.CDS.1 [Saccharomyces cerevisiae]|nr:AFH_G0023420.mRNA.1.CDS.1 [Saccharomyces cerevisiae]CAI6727198.1 AFH_G0023420.mRNA.1.CDS.1 [Saccharomyces cerevisiae]
MKEKDIRSTLASLIRYNPVEIQEVPRTLIDSHQGHGEIKARKLYIIPKKTNRDDVKEERTNYYIPSELNQLKMVNERELNVFARFIEVTNVFGEVFPNGMITPYSR